MYIHLDISKYLYAEYAFSLGSAVVEERHVYISIPIIITIHCTQHSIPYITHRTLQSKTSKYRIQSISSFLTVQLVDELPGHRDVG